MGIEPTLSAWEAEVLPLNYTRVTVVFLDSLQLRETPIYSVMVKEWYWGRHHLMAVLLEKYQHIRGIC